MRETPSSIWAQDSIQIVEKKTITKKRFLWLKAIWAISGRTIKGLSIIAGFELACHILLLSNDNFISKEAVFLIISFIGLALVIVLHEASVQIIRGVANYFGEIRNKKNQLEME